MVDGGWYSSTTFTFTFQHKNTSDQTSSSTSKALHSFSRTKSTHVSWDWDEPPQQETLLSEIHLSYFQQTHLLFSPSLIIFRQHNLHCPALSPIMKLISYLYIYFFNTEIKPNSRKTWYQTGSDQGYFSLYYSPKKSKIVWEPLYLIPSIIQKSLNMMLACKNPKC